MTHELWVIIVKITWWWWCVNIQVIRFWCCLEEWVASGRCFNKKAINRWRTCINKYQIRWSCFQNIVVLIDSHFDMDHNMDHGLLFGPGSGQKPSRIGPWSFVLALFDDENHSLGCFFDNIKWWWHCRLSRCIISWIKNWNSSWIVNSMAGCFWTTPRPRYTSFTKTTIWLDPISKILKFAVLNNRKPLGPLNSILDHPL